MTHASRARNEALTPVLPPNTSVKVVGLGGVGGIVARYGAMFLASLGEPARLVLIDGDAFEPSNATRMFFSGHGNKAEVTRDDLLARFADSPLTLAAVPEYLTPDSLPRLVREGDVVLLCVDNHATRKMVSDFCRAERRDVCLISAGNDGVGPDSGGVVRRGSYGNVQVYVRRDGEDRSAPLTSYHPEIETPADHRPDDASCTELVASVPQILFANLATASAVCNALWLHLCGSLHYGELCFDIADGVMRPLPFPGPHAREKPQPPGNGDVVQEPPG